MTFPLYGMSIKKDIDLFIEQANTLHPTIKFTAEISEKEITFLGTIVYKGERFLQEASYPRRQNSLQADRDLSIYIHPIPLDTHQALREALFKGKAIRLLRTNSSEKKFQEAMCNFKTRLEVRGYPKNLIESTFSVVSFAGRQSALKKQTKQT